MWWKYGLRGWTITHSHLEYYVMVTRRCDTGVTWYCYCIYLYVLCVTGRYTTGLQSLSHVVLYTYIVCCNMSL